MALSLVDLAKGGAPEVQIVLKSDPFFGIKIRVLFLNYILQNLSPKIESGTLRRISTPQIQKN